MAMIQFFATEWQQLRADAQDRQRSRDAARLRRKLWRKEVGLSVVTLGAMAMFLDVARGLPGLVG